MGQHKGDIGQRVQWLAVRHRSGELLGATTARLGAELVRRHGSGNVPAAEISAATQRFEQWLTLACDAARAPAPVDEAEDGDDG